MGIEEQIVFAYQMQIRYFKLGVVNNDLFARKVVDNGFYMNEEEVGSLECFWKVLVSATFCSIFMQNNTQ